MRASLRAALLASLMLASAATPAPAANLRVRGNGLVDGPGPGQPVQLRGVSRSGLEYQCIQGNGFFESQHPYTVDNSSMIKAMTSWDINAVRVPLNEDCWLGVNTPRGLGGAPYRRIVRRYVKALNEAHLYVILDLHWAAPPAIRAGGQLPMADAALAPRFWRSVARAFKHNHRLIFDLFNEPFSINWSCWRDGCQVRAGGVDGQRWPSYRAAGMQQLVRAVRSTGARQPLLLSGINYALNLSGWSSHLPRDPKHGLIASDHTYGGLSPCNARCEAVILSTHRRHPVLLGELGETDCAHAYIDNFMRFADTHGVGYLGWAWDAGGGWTCTGGPSLISDYQGTPTAYGVGFRDHLRALGAPRRPS